MGLQVWTTIMEAPPGTNPEGHDHDPCAILFTLAIYKDE